MASVAQYWEQGDVEVVLHERKLSKMVIYFYTTQPDPDLFRKRERRSQILRGSGAGA